MREEITADSLPLGIEPLRIQFADIARRFHMGLKITDGHRKNRTIILVSQLGHCLYDLFARWHAQELDVDIVGVISNHNTLKDWVEWYNVPFHQITVPPSATLEAYALLTTLFEKSALNAVVLARHVQILPSKLCTLYPGSIINIHHSFLPSLIGAKRYHQAYSRGVKLVGATCHYVTANLDKSPIIEQDFVCIDHSDDPNDLIYYERDIEKTVLAKKIRYHLEDRVPLHGKKNILFR